MNLQPAALQDDVALFIDWENIKYSLLNRENRLPNAQALKEAAGHYGRVVTAKAYANWQEGQNLRDPNDLYAVGIEPIYVPTIFVGPSDSNEGMPRRKNSVDVKLAVDAVEFSLANPNVSAFVLVTGDGDFIHLVNTLRMRGKHVVVIGTSWNTSWQLTSSADHFIPYDVDVDPIHSHHSSRASTPPIEDAFKILVEVVRYVREKRRPNVFAQIKLLMISRLANFDEQAYGFAKFKDFMKEAERRGLIKTTTAGLTDRAYLPNELTDGDVSASDHEDVEHRGLAERVEANGNAGRHGNVDEETMSTLIRFANKLEESSPFMSFNYISGRTYDSHLLPLTPPEIASLIDAAIQEGIFLTDSRTILDRGTGEYRDINIFRVNRRHPLVSRAIDTV